MPDAEENSGGAGLELSKPYLVLPVPRFLQPFGQGILNIAQSGTNLYCDATNALIWAQHGLIETANIPLEQTGTEFRIPGTPYVEKKDWTYRRVWPEEPQWAHDLTVLAGEVTIGVKAGAPKGARAPLKSTPVRSPSPKIARPSKASPPHFTDFADEAAEIQANAVRSRGLNPNQKVLSMAMSRKDALRRLDALAPQVEKHLQKIASNPGSRDVAHWQAEIRAFLDQMESAVPHVGKKTCATWAERIAEYRRLLGG